MNEMPNVQSSAQYYEAVAIRFFLCVVMPSIYLRVIEDGMIVNSWEEHLHHVRFVIQRWSAKGLQICSQVGHIRLEFGKGCTDWVGKKKLLI